MCSRRKESFLIKPIVFSELNKAGIPVNFIRWLHCGYLNVSGSDRGALAWSGRSIGRALQHAEQIAETHQAHLPLALVEGRLHAEQVPVLSGFASVQYMRPNARSGQLDHRSMEWRSSTDEAVGVEELWKTAVSMTGRHLGSGVLRHTPAAEIWCLRFAVDAAQSSSTFWSCMVRMGMDVP